MVMCFLLEKSIFDNILLIHLKRFTVHLPCRMPWAISSVFISTGIKIKQLIYNLSVSLFFLPEVELMNTGIREQALC